MRIQRVTAQSSKTLEEFYAELATKYESWRECGDSMLDLLEQLRSLPGPDLWGCTSHACLHLQREDSTSGRSIASVDAASGRFSIARPLTFQESPWPGAMVYGQAGSAAEAAQMIVAIISGATQEEDISSYDACDSIARRLGTTAFRIFQTAKTLVAESDAVSPNDMFHIMRLLARGRKPSFVAAELGVNRDAVIRAQKLLDDLRG